MRNQITKQAKFRGDRDGRPSQSATPRCAAVSTSTSANCKRFCVPPGWVAPHHPHAAGRPIRSGLERFDHVVVRTGCRARAPGRFLTARRQDDDRQRAGLRRAPDAAANLNPRD